MILSKQKTRYMISAYQVYLYKVQRPIVVRIKGQWLKQGKLYMNKHLENFRCFSQHMGLCDNHHAKEQEDDAVTGGRHGPREGKGS